MSKRHIVAPLEREPRRRREPGPITVRYVCPVCSGPHLRRDCPRPRDARPK